MEGLAGISSWEECYDGDESPKYQYGRTQLTAEVNAAVAGAFDGGATEVRVLDGHGRNQNKGFIPELLDKRVKKQWIIPNSNPVKWEGVDASVGGLAVIGQHAMAGTVNGFLDHTMNPRQICRFTINDIEHGEPGYFALYSGYYNIPFIYGSGDEAFCAESKRLFPQAITTPTKRGTGWATCELYPADRVRENIRRDIAQAVKNAPNCKPWKLPSPIKIGFEFACSESADAPAKIPGVKRPHARSVEWFIDDPRDVYGHPSPWWKPLP